MNIKTKEFNISENELRHFTRRIYYNGRVITIFAAIFAYFAVITIAYAMVNHQFWFVTTYLGVFLIAQLGSNLISSFITKTMRLQFNTNFQNRNCEITDNYFSMNYEDGSLLKLQFNHFIKVTRNPEYYLMTYSEYYLMNVPKTNFYYLPFRAFNSENDINEFETLIKN